MSGTQRGHFERAPSEPNDGPGPDGHHVVTGECFACLVGVSTGPESHGDHCSRAACRCDAGSQGNDSLRPGPQHDDDCARFRSEATR